MDGVCAVPGAMFRDDWGLFDWFKGPAGLDPIAMRELARASADAQQDLEGPGWRSERPRPACRQRRRCC